MLYVDTSTPSSANVLINNMKYHGLQNYVQLIEPNINLSSYWLINHLQFYPLWIHCSKRLFSAINFNSFKGSLACHHSLSEYQPYFPMKTMTSFNCGNKVGNEPVSIICYFLSTLIN